jgi:hypothetical protein
MMIALIAARPSPGRSQTRESLLGKDVMPLADPRLDGRAARAIRVTLSVLMLVSASIARSIAADEPSRADVYAPLESFSEEQRAHWAYQPAKRPQPPAVKDRAWIKNAIDRFILAEIEKLALRPAAEADRVALVRRVTFDLTGLPPAPDDVAAFVNDARTDAYERLVDRLLASPHYGERWGQHWLDLAHYADSNGFELDAERPDAWRYRDWVVRKWNADLPYDRFVALQIAGDDLEPGDHDALIATGFCRCGPRELVGGNVIPEVKRQNELTEITGTVGSVFLGLTIGCARCHDHKFDAIPTTDYYRLQAFFAASELTDVAISSEKERESYGLAEKAVEKRVGPLKQEIAKLEAPYRAALKAKKHSMLCEEERAVIGTPEKDRTPAQKRLAKGLETSLRVTWEEVAASVAANRADHDRRERLKREIEELERSVPRPPAHAMALVDRKAKSGDTFVLRRGEYKNKGPKVASRPPGVILACNAGVSFPSAIEGKAEKTGRRAALARWLTDCANPLTARVIVNRLWQHHFGRGIAATSSDFGVRGEPPTHPELLDWLASELVADGWSLKALHRLMVTSATYRQSNKPDPKTAADDPENTLFSRMNRRRLDAEGVRDAMLATSGELNSKMGGPGVLAPLEKEVKDLIFTEAEVVDLWPVARDPREHARRALYLFRKRNVRYPLFDAFDAPDTQSACPRRAISTHALQALTLLNSDFAAERARALAERVARESGADARARIRKAYAIMFARDPRPLEVERALSFLERQGDVIRHDEAVDRRTDRSGEAGVWADFALTLLNSNEFLYVP